MEGLYEVVACSLAQPPDAVLGGRAAGQDDHRQLAVELGGGALGGADPAQYVEPGGVGEGEVEQQGVGLAEAAEAQRVGGGRCGQGAVAVGLEVVDEQLAGQRIVLADDDRREGLDLGQHLWLLGGGFGFDARPTPGVEWVPPGGRAETALRLWRSPSISRGPPTICSAGSPPGFD